MKDKIYSFVIPLVLVLLGFTMFGLIDFAFELNKVHFFWVITIGLVLAASEILIMSRLPEGIVRWATLDGFIFPFVSLGICTGLIVL